MIILVNEFVFYQLNEGILRNILKGVLIRVFVGGVISSTLSTFCKAQNMGWT